MGVGHDLTVGTNDETSSRSTPEHRVLSFNLNLYNRRSDRGQDSFYVETPGVRHLHARGEHLVGVGNNFSIQRHGVGGNAFINGGTCG